jgi:hypothetical protein
MALMTVPPSSRGLLAATHPLEFLLTFGRLTVGLGG